MSKEDKNKNQPERSKRRRRGKRKPARDNFRKLWGLEENDYMERR